MTPRASVVAPIKVPASRRPQTPGKRNGIFRYHFQRSRRMNAKIEIGYSFTLFIHAKEILVLLEQLTGQQVAYRVQLIFDLQAKLPGSNERVLTAFGFDEFHHF